MTNRPSFRALFTLIFLTSLLSACGFHLRGKMDIASEIANLSVSGNDIPYMRALKSALTSTGITVTDDAEYRLILKSLEKDSGTQTAASAGRYERTLSIKATYQLQTRDGLQLFAPMVIANERFMTEDKNQVNAAQSEETYLFKQLQREVISSTVRRIAGISGDALTKEEARARTAVEAEQKAAEAQ
ncbi:hypothetical protein EOPP23_11235 [Endozoicomonas sp. OPT23]|uniref:LPS-assembly lipoprotein LptE n=1 Tax=Endozoicomonas sp. OPT23 TaxID=2072845 RepID=UPI00129A6A20|nr:hypothetical protein [Endozoicomonas sp. OPT23]MRI33559.1 hypothetical protein [Endozoicomonas sp. OPT23]